MRGGEHDDDEHDGEGGDVMDDIVKRLKLAASYRPNPEIFGEAADEIVRLRAAVKHLIDGSDECRCYGMTDEPCPWEMPGDPIQTVWPRPESRAGEWVVVKRDDGKWVITGDETNQAFWFEPEAERILQNMRANEAYHQEQWDRWFGGDR